MSGFVWSFHMDVDKVKMLQSLERIPGFCLVIGIQVSRCAGDLYDLHTCTSPYPLEEIHC